MNKRQDSEPDAEPLDHILAKYYEEAEAFKDNLSELCALQEKYVEDHPDLAQQLLSHFENESIVLSDLGSIPCRLPDFGRYTDIKYGSSGFLVGGQRVAGSSILPTRRRPQSHRSQKGGQEIPKYLW